MLRARADVRVVVKTSAPLRLFERTLAGRCELVSLECDAGMVQIDSLHVDTAASVERAVRFQQQFPILAATEAAFLRQSGACVAIGDIPPLASAAARSAGIPSLALGNFTWDWIYDGYSHSGAGALARELRSAYQSTTVALRLPMAGGFDGLSAVTRDIPFIARRSRRGQDDVRVALGLPPRSEGKPLVLMSFGGYGVARLDTAALAELTGYTIATTDLPVRDNAIAPAPGLLHISEQDLYRSGMRYEDLVRGADVVVTKPGYGIISEAIANDCALLYTSRGHFVEYDVLVREMPRYLRAGFIEQEDLLGGNWSAALQKLLNQPAAPERPPLNGAEVAAGEILRLIGEKGERRPKRE